MVTTVEGITEYRLDNGLRILLAPDASKPTTTVNMTYLVGSRHENYGETGMAHLLEHLLFKGTPTIRNALGEFSRRGMQANGSTWVDRTNYYASFAADPDNLDWYLGWQADAMVNSLIARADLDSEMTVVRNEMESGENNPFRVLMSKMQAVAYQWHNYGKTTIGARSDVENVNIERLQAFYRRYYQPDNAVLIVSGKFDPTATLTTIERVFSAIPKPERELPPLYTEEPVQDGERSVTLRRSGGVPLLAALYHSPPGSHPDAAAMDLLATILTDTPSGRLYKSLVETNLAASVFGFTMALHDPGTSLFGVQLAPGADPAPARDAMLKTLETLREHPITEEELKRARTRWLKDWDRIYADPQRVGVSLSESIATGDWRLFFKARDWVRETELEAVQRVAEQYLIAANRTLGEYVPTAAPVRAPRLAPVDLGPVLDGYAGDPRVTEVDTFDTTPANIDARTQRKTLELDNGPVQLALLPKPTRGQRVHARLALRFGDVDQLRGQATIAQTVASLLRAGTPSLTRQHINDRLDELKAEVGFSGSGTTVNVSIATERDYLPDTLALVFTLLRESNFPADQLDELRRKTLSAIETAREEPTSLASHTLNRHSNHWEPGDIRYTPSFDEQEEAVNALKREDLAAFHQRFYGAGRLSMTAVGDFDPEAVEKAVVDGVKGWQRAPAYTRVPMPYQPVEPKRFVLEVPDKANAFYVAALPVRMQDTDPDYPAALMANYLLGSSATSRLWNRIRETEGLSYDVRSQFTVSSYEPSGSLAMYAIYAASNRDQLEQAFQQELDKALKEGFTEQEVKDGIAALLNQRKLSRAQDNRLASTWSTYLELGRSFADSEKLDQQLAALTVEEVNQALRKILDPKALSSVMAGSFNTP